MSESPPFRVRPERRADAEFGFADLVDVLVRRKWTVLLVTFIVTAASVFSATQQGTTYTSKASALLASTSATSVEAQQRLSTEEQLAHSRSVAEIVKNNLDLTETPEQILSGLSVSVVTDTKLMEFRYSAATPGDAERYAQAFVDAYMEHQAQLIEGLVASSTSIDQLVTSLRTQLTAAQTRVVSSNPAEASAAKTEVDALTSQIATVEQQRTTLLTSALVTSTLAERASPAVRNAAPIARGAVVGFLAGLSLGAFAAFVLNQLVEGRRRRRERIALVSAIGGEARPVPPDQGELGDVASRDF